MNRLLMVIALLA